MIKQEGISSQLALAQSLARFSRLAQVLLIPPPLSPPSLRPRRACTVKKRSFLIRPKTLEVPKAENQDQTGAKDKEI